VSGQADVFVDTSPLVTSVLDGFNVCIFAYGQTGSGKTHTMEGPKGDPGVNSRALEELFRLINERGADFQISITASLLEIYNETIRDLLVPQTNQKLEVYFLIIIINMLTPVD
jgi:kinesin family protein C2/C3